MRLIFFLFFFFNDRAPTEIYTLPLHDALPISFRRRPAGTRLSALPRSSNRRPRRRPSPDDPSAPSPTSAESSATRSEEHTSELQSQSNLVCRLLLEKKKTQVQRHRVCIPRHDN